MTYRAPLMDGKKLHHLKLCSWSDLKLFMFCSSCIEVISFTYLCLSTLLGVFMWEWKLISIWYYLGFIVPSTFCSVSIFSCLHNWFILTNFKEALSHFRNFDDFELILCFVQVSFQSNNSTMFIHILPYFA